MSKTTPTQRTLAHLRRNGLQAFIVERWIPIPGHPGGGVKKDMGGFADIIACGSGEIIAIQCTSGLQFSRHINKYRDSDDVMEAILAWVRSGGYFEIWGWRKLLAKRGGKAKVWRPRIERYAEEHLMEAV